MLLTQPNGFFSLNLKGHLLSLESPIIMGIVNLTPDSFYDGNKDLNIKEILKKIEKMLIEGATIIDLGAMSSRPFSSQLNTEAEMQRLQEYLPAISFEFKNTHFSIDTYRSEVANFALDHGCCLINDISGGRFDPKIIPLAAQYKVPYILMHMQGTPNNMQINPSYDSILAEIAQFFGNKLAECKTAGIKDIILDVGFGFGKSSHDNFKLLKHLDYFKFLNCPILTGISRKSMIYKNLNIEATEALNGTSTLHFEALRQGSQILRVHDVKEAAEVIKLYNLYKNT